MSVPWTQLIDGFRVHSAARAKQMNIKLMNCYTILKIKTMVLWDVIVCTLVNTYLQFVGNICLSLLPEDGGNKILQKIILIFTAVITSNLMSQTW